jgi:outer membrane receptor for ferrienterochelin and colicins
MLSVNGFHFHICIKSSISLHNYTLNLRTLKNLIHGYNVNRYFQCFKPLPSSSVFLLLCLGQTAWAEQNTPNAEVTEATQQLKTIQLKAQDSQNNTEREISAIPKTIISQEEMLLYGDQSVQDALRRAAGFQMPSAGQGPRGNKAASGMRFRGGSAPTFLINGEAVQGGPRGGMSIIDTITTDMIERIEVIKQPSVAQASVASSAVINIILKKPLNTLLNGNVRIGYGDVDADDQSESRRQISLQADGSNTAWAYSFSANQMWNDNESTSLTTTRDRADEHQRVRSDRTSQMFAPRLEYQLDDAQKLIAEVFYRNNQSKSNSRQQQQNNDNDSIRLNTRYERSNEQGSDKIRLTAEQQTETQRTISERRQSYTDEQIDEYALAYDGVRKLDPNKQVKFGLDARNARLASNEAETLDEQRYALYLEGNVRLNDQNTITLGARQEFLQRDGLVDFHDQYFNPVLAHRYDFNDHWSLQSNLSQAYRAPRAQSLMSNVTISNDSDAGSLNNPDRGGNPNLRPEKIAAFESTLGYNTPSGGVNITGFYRDIDDFIENAIRLEKGRYVQRPQNMKNAETYGVEVSGRYAIKETKAGHAFMLNAQLSTVHATVDDGIEQRLASDVAPYTASTGISYNFKPMRLATSVNLNYTPQFSRELENQPYERTTNARFNIDASATKTLDHGFGLTLSARNLLGTAYKEFLTDAEGLYQARHTKSIPSYLLTLEKKF